MWAANIQCETDMGGRRIRNDSTVPTIVTSTARIDVSAARTTAQGTFWNLAQDRWEDSRWFGSHRCKRRVNQASFISHASCRVVRDADEHSGTVRAPRANPFSRR